MDVRKLISFGKGSFIISMPKSWIEKNNLKKGDLISISDDGSQLVISAEQEEQKSEPREITIEARNKSLDMLKTEIVSSYLNYYDLINILFESKDNEAPKIKEIIRNLSGLEIMEQTSTRIVAKNLININEISIQNIIRRIDVITRAMMEDVMQCATGQCNYDSIHSRDSDVNRLFYLGFRVIKKALKNPRIAKSLGTEPWQLNSDQLVLLRIEKIADRQKRIARYLNTSNLDRGTVAELDKIHSEIKETYNQVMKSYYNKDKSISYQIEATNKGRIALCDDFLERCTNTQASSKNKNYGSNLVAIAKIVENLKATAAEIRNIARTVLCYE